MWRLSDYLSCHTHKSGTFQSTQTGRSRQKSVIYLELITEIIKSYDQA